MSRLLERSTRRCSGSSLDVVEPVFDLPPLLPDPESHFPSGVTDFWSSATIRISAYLREMAVCGAVERHEAINAAGLDWLFPSGREIANAIANAAERQIRPAGIRSIR